MRRYLIDSQGRVWDPFDEQLLVKLGDPDPDYDIVSYAVRNLGFVDVTLAHGEDEVTVVRIRELAVTTPALFAASEVISRLAVGPVAVISGNEQWTERRFDRPAEAVAWLRERTNAEVLVTGFSDIAVVTQDLGRLSHRRLNTIEQNDDRLALLFKKWRIASGRFSYDTTEFMVNFGLLDRAALAQPSNDGTLLWNHLGHKLNVYERDDKVWHLSMVGRPVDEQNDSNYGAFTRTTFQHALANGQPRLDHVDAVIRNRRGAHRTRYDRLILPWQTEEGAKILSTLSYKTEHDTEMAA
jgi:hypothetical protein